MQNGLQQLTRAQYDALTTRVNWSTLKSMAKSPAHYRHRLTSKTARKDSSAMKVGRVAHLATFEPEAFQSCVAVWDGERRYGKKWDSFVEQHTGRELLTQDEYDTCMALQRAVRADTAAMRYVAGGIGEASVLWTHAVPALAGLDGFAIDCKARLDFVAQTALVDLKTTSDASPDGFGRASFNFCYHIQAAFYSDGYEAATGKRLPYVIVAVETAEPYVVQVYRVPDEVLELGREEYRALLERLNVCRKEARWPGYAEPGQELSLSLPRWARPANEDEDVTGLGLVIGE